MGSVRKKRTPSAGFSSGRSDNFRKKTGMKKEAGAICSRPLFYAVFMRFKQIGGRWVRKCHRLNEPFQGVFLFRIALF